MASKLKSFFLKSPTDWRFWVLLALVFKGILFFLRIIQGSEDTFAIQGFHGYVAPDSRSYILPIESFLKTGHYLPDYRMPGYGAFYYLLRLFFNQAMASNILILLQYILASISVYFLAQIVKKLTNNNALFYLSFYLFLVSSYSNYMDDNLMTESLCTSFLVFGTYFLLLFLENKKYSHLLLSAIIIGWAVFLRPVFVAIIILYALFIIYYLIRNKQPFIKALLLFVLPFAIADGAWTLRNYNNYKEITPLTAHSMWNSPDYQQSCANFIRAWGGNFREGVDQSVLFWFGYTNEYSKTYKGDTDPFPTAIYTSKFNQDSLLHLKTMFTALRDTVNILTQAQRAALQDTVTARFKLYTNSIKHEKPFLYYIKAPLIYLKEFLTFHWASYNVIGYSVYHKGILNAFNNVDYVLSKPFHNTNPINWLYVAFNYIMLFAGLIGSFLLLKASLKNLLLLLLIIIPVFTIVGHALILRQMDNRYLLPCWPFVIACAAYAFFCLYNRFLNKKTS